MPAVGAYLRELRERQGVSLDEISRSTRVLHHYLEALETDNMASLPAPVFAKGFIRAYCQALGVSPDEALALYEQRMGQNRAPAPSLVPPPRPAPAPMPAPPPALAVEHRVPAPAVERRESRSRGTVLISFVLLVVLGGALYAVTMALQSGRDDVDAGAAVHVAAPPPPAPDPTPVAMPAPSHPALPPRPLVTTQPQKPQPPVTQPSAAPPASPPSAAPPIQAPPAATGAIASPYRLVARTTETTWMRVRTEDGRTSEETIPANEVREWVSNGPFVLTIGNAGGVSLELNGRPVPRLGGSGAVISRMVLPPDVQ
jgi:cytoskeleton protein RodZ